MKRRSVNNWKTVGVLLLLFWSVQGCISTTRRIPPSQQLLPAQSMTRAEILQKLQTRSTAIKSLTASVSLEASGGGIDTGKVTEWRETTGTFIVERPARIHVIVKLPVVRLAAAEMVSDGSRFNLYIRPENQWVTGDANAPGADSNPVKNLRPKHILDALFVDVRDYLGKPTIVAPLTETIEGQRSYYVVNFVDAAADDPQVLQQLWIDRTDLEVARKIVYGKNGKVESNIEFLNYQKLGDITFPQVVNLQRPVEHYSLKMTFQKTNLNPPLDEDAFELDRPSGVKVVELAPGPVAQ